MPPTSTSKPTYHVLVTGYGPFSFVRENLSWLCVAPLHNKLIQTDSATIHVTALGPLEVSYSTILSLVPGLHARPPTLPSPISEDALMPVAPPPEGYDFTFHLGAGHNGALSIEQVGHKSGYRSPGVDGKMAPIITKGGDMASREESEADRFERERLRQGNPNLDGNGTLEDQKDTASHAEPEVLRGFAEGYECFPEDLRTEVDVPGLMEHLKQQGETRVVASTDAGHFLCDFICFGSLAESQRPLYEHKTHGSTKSKRSKSLFMHVPYDEHKPFSTEELTEAVRQVIAWVCTKEKALPV